MKYHIGQIVYHNLTNEKFMVVEYEFGSKYYCTNEKYQAFTFRENELRGENLIN